MTLNETQKALLQQFQSSEPLVEKERIRTAAQGLTFGFGDEIEAFIRSSLPGGSEYEEIRDELRGKLRQYKEAYPGEALSYELAGALVPAALQVMSGAGAPSAPATIARIAGRGVLEGAASGYGYSEAEDVEGQLMDAAKGGGIGLIAGPAMTLAGRTAGGASSRVMSWVREKLGDKASSAVQGELQRLQQATGKSVEEIIMDISEGRLMSDNKTLMIAIKNIISEGGAAGREALDLAKGRAAATGRHAMGELQERLAPGMDENVVRGMRQSDEALAAAEREAYKGAFQAGDRLSNEASDQMLNIVRSVPGAADDIESLYSMRNLVPLFKRNADGSIDFARAPNLEDAENIRRSVRDKATQYYKGGQGSLGEQASEMEKGLKGRLDVDSPALAEARAGAASRRSAQEAWELGRKSLSANVDELELLVERLDPESLKAFRAGLMDSIRNKARRTNTTLAGLAAEDKQFGQVLRVVLGDEADPELFRSLSIAGDVKEIASKLPPTAGSPTAPLQRERSLAGRVVDAGRIAQGDPSVLMDFISSKISSSAPRLSDSERQQVVRVLFSDDPDLVRRALTDDTAVAALLSKIDGIVSTVGRGVRTGATQQGVQLTNEWGE